MEEILHANTIIIAIQYFEAGVGVAYCGYFQSQCTSITRNVSYICIKFTEQMMVMLLEDVYNSIPNLLLLVQILVER